MVNRKLLSIITPTFNCGAKIGRTINSVLFQNRDLFEYIIVDGGSTDDTLSAVEQSMGDFQLISEKDQGAYDAMNKGIKTASGKYLYFLGAGDCLRPRALEAVKSVIPDDDFSLVYGNVYWVDKAAIYDGEFSKEKLKTFNNICHQAIFYGRSIFEMLGNFDLRFPVLADYAFNIKCFGDDRIIKRYVDYVFADFEGGGMSCQQKDLNFIREYPRLVEAHLK